MNAVVTMLAVAVALMLAGCGGGSSPLTGVPGGAPELVASGSGGAGPVPRVGEGDGTSPTAPGDGSEGDETGPVARVNDGGISWDQFLERLEYMGSRSDGWSYPKTPPELPPGLNAEEQEDFRQSLQIRDYSRIMPYSSPYCEGLYGGIPCGAMKSRIAAARQLPGTRRFRGTLALPAGTGPSAGRPDSHTRGLDFWGGWLDNSVFYAGIVGEIGGDLLVADSIGRQHGMIQFGYSPSNNNNYLVPNDIEDPGIRDEFAGVYRGEAVDMEGNWGTSEVNLAFKLNVPTPQHADQESGTAIQVDLTIDIPAYGERSWRDDGSHSWHFGSGAGDSRMAGEFYYGKEVGGVFQFPHSGGDLVMGAFGAKKVP